MARKNNIRSMRFSDDVVEMIESQAGRNFSEKFENLVTRCMWELPAKEKEIVRLDKEIAQRRKVLEKLDWRLESACSSACSAADALKVKIASIMDSL